MIETELAVVGAGPAGLSGAVEAARAGVQVTLIDENARPGGQLFKQIHKFFGSREHGAGVRGFEIGSQLLEETRALGVRILLDTQVWGISKDLSLGICQNDRMDRVRARKVLLATGAIETPLSFPGWTLPGVMGAGAAQTLMNLHRVLPGRRVLMVGSGNVGLIVAYQLLQAGAEVPAVIDIAPIVGGYGVHASKIRRQGVRILPSYIIVEARGKKKVQEAIIARIGPDGKPILGTEENLAVDCICLAVGLNPLAELAWIVGCEFDYQPERGGFIPRCSEQMETTVPGIYVAGDVAGIDEASCAMEEGKIAALAVAKSLGYRAARPAFRKIAELRQNLKMLRSGPFGELRRRRAKRLMERYQRQPSSGIDYSGALSSRELKRMSGVPSRARLAEGPVVFIECNQKIPCNPCELACRHGAIQVGQPITNVPILREELCTGCGLCIPSCPGLAIFVVEIKEREDRATIKLPYELPIIPTVGSTIPALNREGQVITWAEVLKVSNPRSNDRTSVITIRVPKKFALEVRGILPKIGQPS